MSKTRIHLSGCEVEGNLEITKVDVPFVEEPKAPSNDPLRNPQDVQNEGSSSDDSSEEEETGSGHKEIFFIRHLAVPKEGERNKKEIQELLDNGGDPNPDALKNWYFEINTDSNCADAFDKDFRASRRNFFDLWHLGGVDIGPPHYRSTSDEKENLFSAYYCNKQVQLLENSHVGFGTDPEQQDNCVLSHKAPILDRALFPTYAFDDEVNDYSNKIHFFAQENKTFNKTRLGVAFNLDVIPGVSPGLKNVYEISAMTSEKDIVGVADEVYSCAWSKSWLQHEKLHRHLDIDFRKSIKVLQKLLETIQPNDSSSDASASENQGGKKLK